MYTPPHNRQDDPQAIFAFMREFPFATLVTHSEAGLEATHIPLNVSRGCDSLVITGHVSVANAQAEALAGGAEAMAIFSEPHAYVSPSNYEPGQWVPTWNYVAVHVYGRPQPVTEREGKLAVLRQTIAATEPAYGVDFEAFPEQFIDAKLKGIFAFEMAVTRVEARWKLSQDRKPAERERIAAGLREGRGDPARRLAEMMDAPVRT